MKFYFAQIGLSYAGMFSKDQMPEVFCGWDEKQVDQEIYDAAVEYLQSYEGMHGIPHFTDDQSLVGQEIDGVEYEDFDSVDDHLDYYKVEVTKESYKKFKNDWGDVIDQELERAVKEDPESEAFLKEIRS